MNSSIRVCLLAILLAGMLLASPAYGERPLLFEQHQAADGGMTQFSARASGRKFLFSASGVVSEWDLDAGASDPQPEIAMRLMDARPDLAPRAVGTQAGGVNYLVGSLPDRWRIGVPLFEKIIYPGVYPGIDLIYYGNQNQLEYDFVVAPAASWRSIRLAFSGAQAVEIDPNGDLKVQTHWGWLRHRRPRVYQQLASGRSEISGHYVLRADRQVGFEIGAYDPAVPLVIDPTLVYSSYLGGSAADNGYSVAVDSSGCAYTVGETWSTNFPLLNPVRSVPAGDTDIFVTKWNAAGTGILYSTYIGGSNRDVPLSIAVDAAGNAHITGYTYSANFPTTSGALRTTFSGQSKAFVLELNPSGNSLIYSTFLGGSGNDYATGIAVDATGQAYISGYTASIDFPVSSNAFQSSYGGGEFDGFFAKLNPAGSQLVYASYLGGIGNDTASAVALDPTGNVYLTGQTQSSNFPVLQALQTTYSQSDAFVVKLNASSQVLYSTYLGGTGSGTGTGIAADAAGNAYVAGYTTAPDFPVTSGAYQPGNHGGYDAFVAKLSADGSAILNATYFGGSGSESTSGIALDSSGDVFVAGSTNSIDLPLQAPVQASYSGAGDAFLAAFNNQLSSLYLSTYYGGAQSETGAAVAVDSSGNAYLTGSTNSGGSTLGIPITAGAFQTSGQGGFDTFLAKFSFSGISLTCSASSPAPLNIPAGGPAEQVGDLVLTCTGGTVGPAAVANIQITLNGNVASGVQPELLIDNPPPSSQVPNVNLFLGSVTGTSSILFSGVSFTVPGPAAAHILRITDVQINAATIPSPGQVVATVSVVSSSPPLTVIQPQQTVATAGVQLQSFMMSASAAPANCLAPPATSTFLLSAAQALVWFQVAGAVAGDVIQTNWYAPGGTLYQSSTLDAGSASGSQCFWDTMNISGSSTPMSGAWQVSAYWNGSLLFTAPFNITTTGIKELVWQNNTTRQVTANYYSGTTVIGWNWLNAVGSPGWTVVAVADMNGDGVPDLIWQNDTTREVTVNYYGGTGGASIIGWNWLNAAGSPGWTVVAVADMNGDGVPDLIWQNDTTRQVTVNYYGGTGGASIIGWNWLNIAGAPGWTVVAAADLNGDGVPDLIWQNDTTHQVTVNYYGGTGGASVTGWNWLNIAGGSPGWTVAGASDFNGDGTPDLVWQNTSTGMVTVNFYGGAQGAVYQGWAWLNSVGASGWHALVSP
jgi:FG-GAP-like repeat/Beta-propeller repeat